MRKLASVVICVLWGMQAVRGQNIQPMVAIHDSELTRALESIPASGATPTGTGTTGFQWWPTDWHYFVMPEALKEALRSDGTAFTVVGDSNITAGVLLTNGQPKYPIVISLASEAVRDDEIARFTNYVAAGGFLFVGSSAFTRTTNGTTRGDFAFANALGVHLVVPGLTNWTSNNSFTTQVSHTLLQDFPSGALTLRLPDYSEEISWGISPNHPFLAPHDLWQVRAGDATVLATGDSYPYLLVKQYGKGYFIYHAAFQPLIGHGGFAPAMYAYMIFRRAIEWAFAAQNLTVPKLSPWPYPYDAAFMIRHDLENFTNEIADVAASAQVEFTNGAKGDYYFCTGTLRQDASPTYNTNTIVTSLRQAVTSYGATIGPHNGGLKNPDNAALVRGQLDYWHWGPDEALDVTPSGYTSGKAYATASISNSFNDIEGWLKGITNGLRVWCACYFNGTRDDSYDLQDQLNVRIAGDQKIGPFPHWTFSTRTPGKRYRFLSEPVSDWFVGGLVAQSLEPWHPPGVQTSTTMHAGVDFYYNLGFLINFYSHTLSTGEGPASSLTPDYLTYSLNPILHPRLWSANAVSVYQWWQQRSNVQVTARCSTNSGQSSVSFTISGSTHPNTAVEALIPGTNSFCSLQVLTNGVLAGGTGYRVNGQVVKVLVGTTVTNVVVSYYAAGAVSQVFSENFDGVSAPALPPGWTSSASGAQSAWVTQTSQRDTAPNAAFSTNATNVGLNELDSPSIQMPVGAGQLSFRNNYNLETGAGTDGFDGGVLEIKIGTNAYTDILAAGGSFVTGGYNSAIDTNYGNPLAGRQAWSGNSGGFSNTVVNLPASAGGQTIRLRWRCGTDSSNAAVGWWIDTVAITSQVCLCCVGSNTPPVLPMQTNRTLVGTATLVVTNTATDAQSLSYQLSTPPLGATIDANGVITWTPAVNQVPSTNTFTTIVTDSGSPPLSATNSFLVFVLAIHNGPTLPVQTNRTINELTTLTVSNTAIDSDVPPLTLTYTVTIQPTYASNNPAVNNGVITWTPNEAQGPSTNVITTVVTDNGTPPLSATNVFTNIVNEVNLPPVLPVQGTKTIAALTPLIVTNTATDQDIPINPLTYVLQVGPTNAAIDTNGVITWTPTLAQNNSSNFFLTTVTDSNPWAVNSQHLSATNGFVVIVTNNPIVVIAGSSLAAESCYPTNGAIDPGETVTMIFTVTNIGYGGTSNLVATLLTNNGVLSPSAPQHYGVLTLGGGSVSEPFSFTANGSCGGTITANLQLQDGASNLGTQSVSFALGPLVTVLTQSFDNVTAPALPAGWTTSASGAQLPWFTTNSLADTPPNAAFSTDAGNIGVNELDSPSFVLPGGPSQLIFRHNYNLEFNSGSDGYDGGILEIKIGGNGYSNIVAAGGSFVSGGYNCTIDTNWGNPLASQPAWSGNSGGYATTLVNLPASAQGQTVQLRWRCGTDNGNSRPGWRIDSIGVSGYGCCVRTPPVLPAQANQTNFGLATLVVTNTATDPSVPPNLLSYVLTAAPPGAQIDTNGIITWTPTIAQVPSTNLFTTVVTDSWSPTMSATNSFTNYVLAVHNGPVLPTQNNQTTVGLATLTVTNAATDNDIPALALTYSLLAAPSNAVISSDGVITWTPVVSQVPSTNMFTTVVSDSGTPSLSATNSFTNFVLAVHNGPALLAQSNRTTVGLATLMVTNAAADNDIPALALTYGLLSAPSNAVISSDGVITWTPVVAQVPSTNMFTTVVSDSGTPSLSATNSFTNFVLAVHNGPALLAQSNRTTVGLATLMVTNAAADNDIPALALTYSLLSAPSNAVISSDGVITWTPMVAQVPSTNVFTSVVSDSGTPSLSATNSFTNFVLAVHNGPVLVAQTNRTTVGLTTLTVTNAASDNDIPALALTYSLLSAPSNALISSDGVITWTPMVAQVPSTNVFTTVVSDSGTPSLSATNSFTNYVLAVHNGPMLQAQSNRTTVGLATLTVTNAAADNDIPAPTLTYSLLSAPSNAVISSDGVITWTPVVAQVPSTNVFTTVVSDNGTPSLSATNSFTNFVLAVHNGPVLLVQSNRTIVELTALLVTNVVTDNDVPLLPLTFSLINPPDGATIDTNGLITWIPSEAQGPGTYEITTVVVDNGFPPIGATNSFTVLVQESNQPPVLPVQTNRTLTGLTMLVVTNAATDADIPANSLTYVLQTGPTNAVIDTNGVISWMPVPAQAPSTNLFTTVATDYNPWAINAQQLSATNSFFVFVVASAVPPPAILIQSITLSNGAAVITWNTAVGYRYRLQYRDDLAGTDWVDVASEEAGTGGSVTVTHQLEGALRRFYRVRLVP